MLCNVATNMNKYLEKIAEKKPQSQGDKIWNATGAHILGGVASTPLMVGSVKAGLKTRSLIRENEASADLGTIKKFMRDNNLHKKVTFNARDHSVNRENLSKPYAAGLKHINQNTSPAYLHNPKGRGFIGGVRNTPYFKVHRKADPTINKDVIMHELGHAKDFATHSNLKRMGTMLGRHPASKLAGGIATIGMLSNEKTRDNAALIPAAQAALVMREEGMANYHAYKGIKAHKGAPAANKFLKRMVKPNTLNYGLAMAAPVAGAVVAKHILNAADKKRAKKNNGND